MGTDATLTDVLPTSDVAADDAVAGRAARGVLLRLGSSRYAVAMADVAEVAAVPGVTRVPGSAPWLSGVANWRGRMLPVLDLRPLLDTPTVPLASSARLVVLARADVVVGLVVEAVPACTTATWPTWRRPRPRSVRMPVCSCSASWPTGTARSPCWTPVRCWPSATGSTAAVTAADPPPAA